MGWRAAPLSELSENFDALRIPVKESDRSAGPYPYYGASGIVDYIDKYIFDGEYLLVAEDGENLRTRKTPVAFLARGQFWVNNHAHILTGNSSSDTRYLCYAVSRADIASYLTGSTMPKLTQANLRRILVPAPPLSDQRAISAVLGALDDKIELNRRTNETLEAIARAIFKSWFVDFDPVRAKMEGRQPFGMDAETAALFPSAMTESTLGQVPSDWPVGRLDDVIVLQRGFDLPRSQQKPGPFPVLYASGASSRHSVAMVKGPGVTTGRSGSLGNVYLVLEDFWPHNTSLWVKAFRCSGPVYAYFLLREIAFAGLNAGSAVPTLNRNHLHGLPTVVAPRAVVDRFESRAVPLMRMQKCNRDETANLAEIRDVLLPKLLSGEIRVQDAERVVSEVG